MTKPPFRASFFNKVSPDTCPHCKKRFNIGGVKVVYRDVFECQKCGHVWVSQDANQVMRYV